MFAKSMILVLVAVLLGVVGQLLLKMGMNQVGTLEFSGGLAGIISLGVRVFSNLKVLGGFAAYGLSSLFWIVVLSKIDLSLAYPMLALNYVLVPLTACLFLGEQVPALRWMGIGVVIVGVVIISRT